MSDTRWQKEFDNAMLQMQVDYPALVAAFIRDYSAFAYKVWDYAPDIALTMARNAIEKRDPYFVMYACGAIAAATEGVVDDA
jgi:hypothetical protein